MTTTLLELRFLIIPLPRPFFVVSERPPPPRHGHASVRNRVLGRERDHPNRAHVQPRQPRAPDMRLVRAVPRRFAAERARLGGAQLAPEEDVPRTAARLDGRRQASREARRGKNVQVSAPRATQPAVLGYLVYFFFRSTLLFQILHSITVQLLPGNHTDVTVRGQRRHSARERNQNRR